MALTQTAHGSSPHISHAFSGESNAAQESLFPQALASRYF